MAEALMQCYEGIAAASARMLSAVRAEDWSGLLLAEADCAAWVERVRGSAAGRSLGAAEARRKQEIIRRVLADDAEIRSCLQPWLARLEALLVSAGQAHRLRQSYGG